MSMLELTEAGVPGASFSFLYGADMFIHILAFPFGLSFTVIGFTVYDSHGISLGSKGPKPRPFLSNFGESLPLVYQTRLLYQNLALKWAACHPLYIQYRLQCQDVEWLSSTFHHSQCSKVCWQHPIICLDRPNSLLVSAPCRFFLSNVTNSLHQGPLSSHFLPVY